MDAKLQGHKKRSRVVIDRLTYGRRSLPGRMGAKRDSAGFPEFCARGKFKGTHSKASSQWARVAPADPSGFVIRTPFESVRTMLLFA
jgi:hypothetical protein